jgi:hypothetical protein
MYVIYDPALLKEVLLTKQEHFIKLKAFQEAMLEMVIALCMIGQRYRLRLAPGHAPIEMEPLLTLRQKNGIEVEVEKR